MAEEVLTMAEAAGKTVIATHSDSRAVYAHPRNLPDDFAKRIATLGGTVGISMAPQHLGVNDYANIDIICDHMLHYLEIGLEDSLTFGCDFDGLDTLPEGIENVSKIIDIADGLRKRGVSEEQIEKIYYKNAERFLKANF
jgi:membrane dipeptidase